ncbi:MAG: molybdopterin-guanine dinucleotide biosynthesis protein B [Chloroflexi bacterium]|nr:molybdopterin-guanine dinucleotide biosynthesis protein B [Chloroflexota bacterium]
MKLPVVAVVGWSDAGKTRVASGLVEAFTARGLRVAAIKHAAHGMQPDRPGSDTDRLHRAGARVTIGSAPGERFVRTRPEGEATLEQLTAELAGQVDIVVAEGFKQAQAPQVLVLGGQGPELPLDPVIAVVGEGQRPEGFPAYGFSQMEELADLLCQRLLRPDEGRPAVSMLVDGLPVNLGDYPERVLVGILRGFLETLRAMPDRPREIRLIIVQRPPPPV